MITTIEAQEMLKQLVIQDWPNQKKQDRQKLHKQLYKKAYPDIFKEKKEMTADGLARILNKGS